MSIIVQYDIKHLIPHQNLSLLPQFCTHRLVRSRRCTDVHRPEGLNPSHNPHLNKIEMGSTAWSVVIG